MEDKKFVELLENVKSKLVSLKSLRESAREDSAAECEVMDAEDEFAKYLEEKYGLNYCAATDIMFGGYSLEEALAEYKGE